MPKIQTYDVYLMPAAGATKTYSATDVLDVYEVNATGGAITLAADMIFSYSGTPNIGSEFKFQYSGGVTQDASSGITVSFFGTNLTDSQALVSLIVLAYWNGASWEVNISKSDVNEILNPIVASGTGFTSTASGSDPITYTGSSNLPNLNNVYVSKSGIDATGLPNRPDRPFLTIAAARAAAVALVPTALARVLITVENGTYTNEQIILYSYIDWDLKSSLIYTTTNTVSITDNNVAVTDCTVYGKANILTTSSSAVASLLRSIELLNASSNVVIYCNNIDIASTGTPTNVSGAWIKGTLKLYCNDITINGATKAAYGIVAETTGIIYGIINNIYAASSLFADGVASAGANSKIYLKANNITTSGMSTGWTVSAGTSAELYLKCNNIYNTGAITATGDGNGAVVCNDITPKIYIECNDIIVTPATDTTCVAIRFGVTTHGSAVGTIMSIKCRETIITGVVGSTTNYAVSCNDNTANGPILMLEGRFKVNSASAVNCIQNTTGTLITHKAVLIPATTGVSVANSGVWKDYGATVIATAASGTAVTVGTPVLSALVV